MPTLFQKKLKSHQDPEMSEEDFSLEDSADHDAEVNIILD